MATHTLKGTRSTTIVMDQDDETWIIGAKGEIATPDVGIDASGTPSGRKIIVNGAIHATSDGIVFGGMEFADSGELTIGKRGLVEGPNIAIIAAVNNLIITNHGSVQGENGIDSHGRHVLYTNDGEITVSNNAFEIEEGSGKIVNTGTIKGEAGVYVPGEANFVVENSGLITGTKVAIEFQDLGKHEVHNTGTLDGDIFFDDSNDLLENTGTGILKGGEIDLGGGDDHFVNSGRLVEKIALGEGNDVADLRGSKATGQIYGELGDDVYIVDRADQQVFENVGEGKDTIRTSVDLTLSTAVQGEIENLVAVGTGNISLTGNELANRLAGSSGANHLDGGLGDDILVGGKGADVFIFATGSGHDTVTDFRPGTDSIDLSGWDGFDSFNDVKAHLTVDGNDLVITSGTDELTLHGVDKADLHAADFSFA